LDYIGIRNPKERAFWRDIQSQAFRKRETNDPVGPSTRIATDKWTLGDALGFHAYAQAIAAFIQHAESSAPLTVSIQAPWGGGKTTLIRMVQEQLDPDALSLGEEASPERGELSVGDALREVRDWIRKRTQKRLPEIHLEGETRTGRKLLTVWFNAWKYESTNQIWAGLFEAIVRQTAARLPAAKRELFWLQLNLRRIDADKVRQKVSERILNYWWRKAHMWVFGCAGAFVASAATGWSAAAAHLAIGRPIQSALWIGMGGQRSRG
jgi:hypothetical protein